MFWIIQENLADEQEYDVFIAALREFGLPYACVKVIPFAHELVDPPAIPAGPVIAFGSTSMDHVAKKYGWKPGTYLNDNFDARIWKPIYGNDLLNADGFIAELGKVPAFSGRCFIRPTHDLKCFAGMVVSGEEFQNWQDLLIAYADSVQTVTIHTPVFVASPKEILKEFRFFVVDEKVITGSVYRWDGRRHLERIFPSTMFSHDDDRMIVESEEWNFAQRMADRWHPARAFALDVAQVASGDLKVIEVNNINSAGFYAADMRAVVASVEGLDLRESDRVF